MISENQMNNEIARTIEKIVGQPCTRKAVGRMKSLSLGFGGKTQPDKNYRVWECGTYNCAWRVVCDGKVLCGSQDPLDLNEFNALLEGLDFGRFASIENLNRLDMRVNFDTGVAIEFITTFGDDDESFHIFGPEHIFIKFSVKSGWGIGPSDKPWPNDNKAE
jgi:hypothetical protein